uniref:Uncharacterized protein n=1 Tax=Anguilla anguilla TaxID=7936 RepID=A0A0E9QA84_ANGAN
MLSCTVSFLSLHSQGPVPRSRITELARNKLDKLRK